MIGERLLGLLVASLIVQPYPLPVVIPYLALLGVVIISADHVAEGAGLFGVCVYPAVAAGRSGPAQCYEVAGQVQSGPLVRP